MPDAKIGSFATIVFVVTFKFHQLVVDAEEQHRGCLLPNE